MLWTDLLEETQILSRLLNNRASNKRTSNSLKPLGLNPVYLAETVNIPLLSKRGRGRREKWKKGKRKWRKEEEEGRRG